MLAALSEEDNNADAKPNLGFEEDETEDNAWEGGVKNFNLWVE